MSTSHFHPIVQAWFDRRFAAPTEAQAQGWPAIASGRHTLIAAPTGSGKTLAAFLTALDGLVRQALDGGLPTGTQVVYVRGYISIYWDNYEGSANFDIYVTDTKGGTPRRVTHTPGNERWPFFSADAKTILHSLHGRRQRRYACSRCPHRIAAVDVRNPRPDHLLGQSRKGIDSLRFLRWVCLLS